MHESIHLDDGSRVAIVGGGPAGSFTAYFLREICDRVGIEVDVDIFEAKDFSKPGPAGCNHCGGIVSESLVQMLASEGIILPDAVVQRGIQAYVLHSGPATVKITPPVNEKRIAAIYRGAGPLAPGGPVRQGLDPHLLRLAERKGAQLINRKVHVIDRDSSGKILLQCGQDRFGPYDFLVGAGGLSEATKAQFEKCLGHPVRHKTTRALIYELYLGEQAVDHFLDHSMHVFLQTFKGLEFAAIIPKGEYATVCLVGDDPGKEMADTFLASQEVTRLLPPDLDIYKRVCACKPLLNLKTLDKPYADRVALVGDSGVTRLYKDGIGAAYRLAKSLAVTAVFQGVSAHDFDNFYWKKCRQIQKDNGYGEIIFNLGEGVIKRVSPLRYGILRTVKNEQQKPGRKRFMSMAMWDTFTGSAPYKDIIKRMLRPGVASRVVFQSLVSLFAPPPRGENNDSVRRAWQALQGRREDSHPR